MRPHHATSRTRAAGERGFTLVEMLITMFLATVIMGATLGALRDAIRANESVARITGMNDTLRLSMDLMVRDFLQVGSGLPPSHSITTPSGGVALLVRLPGPPGTNFTNPAGDPDIGAIVPGSGLGPVVNGVATDTITVLTADNTFVDVGMTAVTATTVTVAAGVNIAAGPDRVLAGQLMMISKGSMNTLVQVTNVNTVTRVLTFAAGDSLNLNQPAAPNGSLAVLNATAPANTPANMRITRVRMISYYLDATTTGEPRLVRRINNGHPTQFNNTTGTVVGTDIDGLRIEYDLATNDNPVGVRFTAADLAGTGQCAPNPCTVTQVRKISVTLTARSNNADQAGTTTFRNSLTSQISLRSMAFVNEYQAP